VINLKWVPHLLSLEFRKLLAYRIELISQFIGPVIIELGIAYYLWKAIFEHRGVAQLGGYTFHGMMLYYLLVPLVDRVVRGSDWKSNISLDIYEGGLTKYLVYPISFFAYKFCAQMAENLVRLVQLLVGLSFFLILFSVPTESYLSVSSILLGILTALFAACLYFSITAIIELIAFWADNVWSLLVMLRFLIYLLGGGLIPLSLFPAWSTDILVYTPFPYLISFPVRTILGNVSMSEWSIGITVMMVWILIFSLGTRQIWQKGLKQYTGVGI
jgi:ABC-2 type transport system permease protein